MMSDWVSWLYFDHFKDRSFSYGNGYYNNTGKGVIAEYEWIKNECDEIQADDDVEVVEWFDFIKRYRL